MYVSCLYWHFRGLHGSRGSEAFETLDTKSLSESEDMFSHSCSQTRTDTPTRTCTRLHTRLHTELWHGHCPRNRLRTHSLRKIWEDLTLGLSQFLKQCTCEMFLGLQALWEDHVRACLDIRSCLREFGRPRNWESIHRERLGKTVRQNFIWDQRDQLGQLLFPQLGQSLHLAWANGAFCGRCHFEFTKSWTWHEKFPEIPWGAHTPAASVRAQTINCPSEQRCLRSLNHALFTVWTMWFILEAKYP